MAFLKKHLFILIILILAVMLRVAYILIFGHTLNLQASGYDVYATNLIAGHGYTRFADLHPDSDLPPLYPFFLVGIYTLIGRSATAVAIVQIGCDVVTILAIYAIGRRIGGEMTGLLAAAFTGFYPYLLFQNLSTNDTGLFIMLFAVGLWSAYIVKERKSWRWAMVTGFSFGLAALTKTLIVLMLPLIIVWWFWHYRRAYVLSLVMILTFVVIVLPWVIRNTQLQGTLTFISTNDGSNLYQGNNPCVADYLLAGWDAQWVNCLKPTPPGLTEVQESSWFRQQAIDYLKDNVGQWPRLFMAKFITLWNPSIMPHNVPPDANLENNDVLEYEQPAFQAARIVHLVYFTPLLILGIWGLYLSWRDHRAIAPIFFVLLTITVAYLIYHPSTRYRSPADPFLFILSAYAVMVGLYPFVRNRLMTRFAPR